MNNYRPEDVVNHLNQKLISSSIQMNFIDIIEYCIQQQPNGKTFGFDERIAGIYELLDLMGYWKDKATPTSNVARIHDAKHAYFASYCKYFISDDQKNKNKAKVAYSIYQINTEVLSSGGK